MYQMNVEHVHEHDIVWQFVVFVYFRNGDVSPSGVKSEFIIYLQFDEVCKAFH